MTKLALSARPGITLLASLPSMTPALAPVLATAGIGLLYYRRMRRQFARQAWRPGAAWWLRFAMLWVLMAGLLVAGFGLPGGALAVLCGIAIGAVLGVFAIRHTRIEDGDGTRWYTPNPWIGGLLSLLLVARLAWRWEEGVRAFGQAAAAQPSVLTLAFAATLVAYYLVNGGGLAWRMRRPA
jgi:hypothetical protein